MTIKLLPIHHSTCRGVAQLLLIAVSSLRSSVATESSCLTRQPLTTQNSSSSNATILTKYNGIQCVEITAENHKLGPLGPRESSLKRTLFARQIKSSIIKDSISWTNHTGTSLQFLYHSDMQAVEKLRFNSTVHLFHVHGIEKFSVMHDYTGGSASGLTMNDIATQDDTLSSFAAISFTETVVTGSSLARSSHFVAAIGITGLNLETEVDVHNSTATSWGALVDVKECTKCNISLHYEFNNFSVDSLSESADEKSRIAMNLIGLLVENSTISKTVNMSNVIADNFTRATLIKKSRDSHFFISDTMEFTHVSSETYGYEFTNNQNTEAMLMYNIQLQTATSSAAEEALVTATENPFEVTDVEYELEDIDDLDTTGQDDKFLVGRHRLIIKENINSKVEMVIRTESQLNGEIFLLSNDVSSTINIEYHVCWHNNGHRTSSVTDDLRLRVDVNSSPGNITVCNCDANRPNVWSIESTVLSADVQLSRSTSGKCKHFMFILRPTPPATDSSLQTTTPVHHDVSPYGPAQIVGLAVFAGGVLILSHVLVYFCRQPVNQQTGVATNGCKGNPVEVSPNKAEDEEKRKKKSVQEPPSKVPSSAEQDLEDEYILPHGGVDYAAQKYERLWGTMVSHNGQTYQSKIVDGSRVSTTELQDTIRLLQESLDESQGIRKDSRHRSSLQVVKDRASKTRAEGSPRSSQGHTEVVTRGTKSGGKRIAKPRTKQTDRTKRGHERTSRTSPEYSQVP